MSAEGETDNMTMQLVPGREVPGYICARANDFRRLDQSFRPWLIVLAVVAALSLIQGSPNVFR